MKEQHHPLDTLQDIKQMMERSSRFISLSGLSGIAAGACALTGAWFAHGVLDGGSPDEAGIREAAAVRFNAGDWMDNELVRIAALTFVAAVVLSFIFTYARSRKTNIPVWGAQARRLMVNVAVPMIAGGIYLVALMQQHVYGMIAPGCLLFYGLAVLNASKYTLPETRYLGYSEIILGIISLFFVGYGLYFWAVGFGVLHIVYGTVMWWRYER